MALFYIHDDRIHDFNRDLFVAADDADEAIQMWRDEWPEWAETPDEIPQRVMEITMPRMKGPLKWFTDNCKQVAGTLD